MLAHSALNFEDKILGCRDLLNTAISLARVIERSSDPDNGRAVAILHDQIVEAEKILSRVRTVRLFPSYHITPPCGDCIKPLLVEARNEFTRSP